MRPDDARQTSHTKCTKLHNPNLDPHRVASPHEAPRYATGRPRKSAQFCTVAPARTLINSTKGKVLPGIGFAVQKPQVRIGNNSAAGSGSFSWAWSRYRVSSRRPSS